ncbi:TPA: dTDP-4-dehydrorhamnose 3,5-epimerase [Salmonella enterica subsp. enterica serovar Cotham]
MHEALIIEPIIYSDARGFFFESYNQLIFEDLIERKINFCQDNQSLSHKGVLRGLHFQVNPKAQGKLVRCLHGKIYDVIVDLRVDSPTYKKWEGFVLSASNKKQLWIPEGCAHGFLSLEDNTELAYKATEYYSLQHERCIRWNDPSLKIEWPLSDYIISEKDKNGISFSEWENISND